MCIQIRKFEYVHYTLTQGGDSESDGIDVDECNCERFGNCILSGELSRVSQQ